MSEFVTANPPIITPYVFSKLKGSSQNARLSYGRCTVTVDLYHGDLHFKLDGPHGTHYIKATSTDAAQLNARWQVFCRSEREIHELGRLTHSTDSAEPSEPPRLPAPAVERSEALEAPEVIDGDFRLGWNLKTNCASVERMRGWLIQHRAFNMRDGISASELHGYVLVERPEAGPIEDTRTARAIATPTLIRLLAYFIGDLSPRDVCDALLEGRRVYTTFRSYALERQESAPDAVQAAEARGAAIMASHDPRRAKAERFRHAEVMADRPSGLAARCGEQPSDPMAGITPPRIMKPSAG